MYTYIHMYICIYVYTCIYTNTFVIYIYIYKYYSGSLATIPLFEDTQEVLHFYI
jgi:hypothetical protein